MPAPSDVQPKPIRWIGSSKKDLQRFPGEVRRRVGGALWDAQIGVDDFEGDTYRAVYTVRFAGVVYVLHAFEKKSKRGIATPKPEMDLIQQRLKRAREDYAQWSKSLRLKSR